MSHIELTDLEKTTLITMLIRACSL